MINNSNTTQHRDETAWFILFPQASTGFLQAAAKDRAPCWHHYCCHHPQRTALYFYSAQHCSKINIYSLRPESTVLLCSATCWRRTALVYNCATLTVNSDPWGISLPSSLLSSLPHTLCSSTSLCCLVTGFLHGSFHVPIRNELCAEVTALPANTERRDICTFLSPFIYRPLSDNTHGR